VRRIPEHIIRSYNETRALKDTSIICHAPFNSLYFSPTGDMIPCCYNRKDIFGVYPEVSIDQAWKGKAASTFRKNICDALLGKGCSLPDG